MSTNPFELRIGEHRREYIFDNHAELEHLTDREKDKKIQLDYLAQILVKIYLSLECEEEKHKYKKCTDCKRQQYIAVRKPRKKRKKKLF